MGEVEVEVEFVFIVFQQQSGDLGRDGVGNDYSGSQSIGGG